MLLGLSRVYLGVHYFSDVLASWCLGLTLVGLWAAAVLTWGRAVLLDAAEPPRRGGWWRWGMTVAGPLIVVLALVTESGSMPLR
jgi:membrane-associated phospholipid phosphatase